MNIIYEQLKQSDKNKKTFKKKEYKKKKNIVYTPLQKMAV